MVRGVVRWDCKGRAIENMWCGDRKEKREQKKIKCRGLWESRIEKGVCVVITNIRDL